MHFNLILQHMVAFKIFRQYIVVILQTIQKAGQFYAILSCFVVSYLFFLIMTEEGSIMKVLKKSTALTFGEYDYEDLDTTKFLIIFLFATIIFLVLMNLLISILGDAYELVTSEKKYYDGKAKLQRSLMYERLAILILRLFKSERDQTYHFLFVSMPLNYGDDTTYEDEGMIGKILSANRATHKELTARIDEN